MEKVKLAVLVLCLCNFGRVLGQSAVAEQEDSEQEQYPKKELTSINSTYAEARPLITDNGNTLYFSRRYHEGNARGEKDYQDVWVSYRDTLTDSWSEPQNLGEQINNRKSNAIASVSPDGEEGIFFNTYRKTKRMPLVWSRQKGNTGEWTKPKALKIENFVNVSDYADFFLSYKEQVLLLAVEGDSVVGEQDLYVAFPDGKGGWREPQNLGATVNTQKSEFAPFMGSDGRSLFFCSYGHEGFGGSDIYLSIRLDDSWTNWSDPVNLGPGINTAIEETYFSITSDFKYLYYTSHQPRDENRNIVRVELPGNFSAINGPVLVQLDSAAISGIMLSGNYTIDPVGRRTNVEGVRFSGWPQEVAEVASEEQEEQEEEEDKQLKAVIALNDSVLAEIAANESFAIIDSIVAPKGQNEFSTGLKNDFTGSPSAQLSPAASEILAYLEKKLQNLDLEVRIAGNIVEFKIAQNLMYEFNSIFVTTDYVPRLSRMAAVLKERPELDLRLAGYTDNIGSAAVNKRVARQRVEQLVYFFQERGVDASRIEILAGGQDNPLGGNEKEEGRAKNRRVESTLKFQE